MSGAFAIAGLHDYASAVRVERDGITVRITPEQLARGNGADRERPIRVEVTGPVRPTVAHVTVDGTDLGGVELVDGPTGCQRVFVPAGDEAATVQLRLPEVRDEVYTFPMPPVRDWTIHLVHHNHFDLGYTDPQSVVFENQRSYLDSVLDIVRATHDDPDDSRFRWVVESLWAFEQWAQSRPEHVVQEFVDYVREGHVELTAMPFNLHADTCSTEELHELLSGARAIADRYGVPFDTAMQTDVPGTPVGLPDALSDFGVKYLSVAHNWAGRSVPERLGGQLLPRLFRWAAPSGKSVLVWMTDSPHGLAYQEGPILGFHEGIERVERMLPVYLQSMVTNPYPYPPGSLGWAGYEEAEGREPYPWDIVHLRTQGWGGDNGPARLQASDIIREWNDTWSSPRLVHSTNAEFFRAAEERLGDEIQTYEGDWGDWWVEGVGSSAHMMKLVRDAQFRMPEAHVLASLYTHRTGTCLAGTRADIDRAYRKISLFNEHTWGGGESWLARDHGFESGEVQWYWKASQALQAQENARAYRERAAAYLGETLGTADGALASYYVVNGDGVRRDREVRFLVRESVVPFRVGFEVRDPRTGESVPFRVDHQEHREHREAGRWVTLRAHDLPPVGFSRFDLHQVSDDPVDAVPFTLGTTPGGAGRPDAAAVVEGGDAAVRAGDPLVLENESLTVTVDLARAGIVSVIDRRSGRELVNQDSLFVGNEYLYDAYTTAPGFNHHSNRSFSGPDLPFIGTRTRARTASFISRSVDDVEQRLVYEFVADGVDRVTVTLRLAHDARHLVVQNRVAKPATTAKESGYFIFPFATDDATVRYEITGGVTGDDLPHVPGAPEHMRAVRSWVTVDSPSDGVRAVWVTKDAPLVQRGTIAQPYAPFYPSTAPNEPGTVISWFHNNVWDTNFPNQQRFETDFTYAVAAADEHESLPSLALATASAVTGETVAVLGAARGSADAPEQASLVEIDRADVQAVSVLPTDDGELLLRLQSFVDGEAPVRLTSAAGISCARRATFLGTPGEPLEVTDGVTVTVPRLGTIGVLLRLGDMSGQVAGHA
ncbi:MULTISPECIES: glycoside hydrolase family 38 N-terminal domain-containing protein [unclassified Isoptericola]|uniref:glycoside hydrolase family 38 N-terminal domain-containing protein n=1 Tax=unclassified Isoptericola TaxID=2623355 RepID=UPI0036461B6C